MKRFVSRVAWFAVACLALAACPKDQPGSGPTPPDEDVVTTPDAGGDGSVGDPDAPPGCSDDAGCPEQQHCVDGACVADVCPQGTSYCRDGNVFSCTENGDAENQTQLCGALECVEGKCVCTADEQCSSSEHCADDECQVDACPQGTSYCQEGDVWSCSANGSEATLTEDCGARDCEAGVCLCASDDHCPPETYCANSACVADVCEQGTTSCDGGSVVQCSANGSSQSLLEDCGVLSCSSGQCVCEADSQCASAEHCSAGSCLADVCPQGTIYCVGSAVMQCDVNGSAEFQVQDCGAMLCELGQCTCTVDSHCADNQTCVDGVCVPEVCVANTVYCKDGDVYQCDGAGVSEKLSQSCAPLDCVDAACVCTADGQCAAAEHCAPSGTCMDDVCEQGVDFCMAGDVYACQANGSGSSLKQACSPLACVDASCVCTEDGQCSADQHCAAGACVADVCAQGQVYCEGSLVYQCAANGSDKTQVQDCGLLDCQDGQCFCTQHDQCGATAHCTGGTCVDNICAPATTFCKLDEVWTCDAIGAGDAFVQDCAPLACQSGGCVCESSAQCAVEEHCGSGGVCLPDVCPQGTALCVAGDVHQCDAEGSASSLVEACGALSCVDAACVCTSDIQCGAGNHCASGVCEVNICEPATSYCKGNEAWACDEHGASETLVQDCGVLTCSDGGCLCVDSSQCSDPQHCAAGVCAPDVCEQGTDVCVGDSVHACNTDGSASTWVTDCGDLSCVGGMCGCVRDDQCPGLLVCVAGQCGPGTSGVHTSDYNIGVFTDKTSLELRDIAVSDTGEVRFLLSDMITNGNIMTLHPDWTFEPFVTADAIATHLGKNISKVTHIGYNSAGDLIGWDESEDVLLKFGPTGDIHTLVSQAELLAALGIASSSQIGIYSTLDVAGDYAYFWASGPTRLIRVTADGTISTVADPTTVDDSVDVIAAHPVTGDVYLYDDSYNDTRIIRITAAGQVSEWMTGAAIEAEVPGYSNGINTMDVDSAGNLWAYDFLEDSLYKISPSKDLTVVFGDTAMQAVGVDISQAIALEPTGSLLLTHTKDTIVRLEPATGQASVVVDNLPLAEWLGLGGANLFSMVAAPDGTLYVWNNNVTGLISIAPDGSMAHEMDTGDASAAGAGFLEFGAAWGMDYGPDGRIYMCDGAVLAYDPANGQIEVLASEAAIKAVDPASYVHLSSVVAGADGSVYVHDDPESNLIKISSGGAVSLLATLGTGYGAVRDMVMGSDGDLYVVGVGDIDGVGVVDTTSGALSTVVSDSQINSSLGFWFNAGTITLSAAGHLLVFDTPYLGNDEHLFRTTTSGSLSLVFGPPELQGPTSMPVDCEDLSQAGGVVYCLDAESQDILFFTP